MNLSHFRILNLNECTLNLVRVAPSPISWCLLWLSFLWVHEQVVRFEGYVVTFFLIPARFCTFNCERGLDEPLYIYFKASLMNLSHFRISNLMQTECGSILVSVAATSSISWCLLWLSHVVHSRLLGLKDI